MHEIRSTLVGREHPGPLVSKTSAARPGAGLSGISVRREEARRCNQRSEDRHLNVLDRAAIKFERRTHDVAVLNVSSRGAMVESELLPRIGARIEVRFADCGPVACFVRWVRNGRIGLEFDTETLIIAPRDVREMIVGGRRTGEQPPRAAIRGSRPQRHHLMLRGELHSPLGSMPVKLRNVSAEGAMLEGTGDIEPPTEVVLEIPGAEAITGHVRWCRSRQIGIRFDNVFDLAALVQPEPEQQSPDMLKPDYLKSEADPNSPWAARWEKLNPDDL